MPALAREQENIPRLGEGSAGHTGPSPCTETSTVIGEIDVVDAPLALTCCKILCEGAFFIVARVTLKLAMVKTSPGLYTSKDDQPPVTSCVVIAGFSMD
ncbi:hypothetical protein TIFTF001_016863 [Ficus carica]|uniref:Uncharacterized protein n=1 Tax=Ficus carica TaxID=3494 RepID=A0AA88A146_FICCA|nr:hypothetical protein TIFTF001_016863 [Ficus carica]